VAKRTAAKRKPPKKAKTRRAVAKRTVAKRATAKRAAKPRSAPQPLLDDLFSAMPVLDTSMPETGDFSLHDAFQQQTMAMLERADLSEEQKQSILVAMNCPCCGGSGLSFTMKLKRKK
jgi:membrane protein involved in colicin uptake